MAFQRNYIQARNLRKEAESKLASFDSILGHMKKEYDTLRISGIPCGAFLEDGGNSQIVIVTKQCWNHLFKHPVKRSSRIEKIERALCFPMAIKLIKKTTTYQEVSREKDRGGNNYLSFGIIGYIRGNRIKVIIRKQEKNTDPKLIL
ncbi:MAG: hypothetical protein AAB592_05770, partial [Patescibacteria group bacterium]